MGVNLEWPWLAANARANDAKQPNFLVELKLEKSCCPFLMGDEKVNCANRFASCY